MLSYPGYFNIYCNNVNNNSYLTFSTYSFNAQQTEFLTELTDILDYLHKQPQQTVALNHIGWFNHSKYNPKYYHFCSALTRENMNKLGGFDERYANGIGFDDDDLVNRIKRLKLEMVICDELSVIHQWHPTVYDIGISAYNWSLYLMNQSLYWKALGENRIHARMLSS